MDDSERMRRFRLMARNMAKMIDWPFEDKMQRAGGDCVCDGCGLPYFDHPEENGLHLACNGELLKL